MPENLPRPPVSVDKKFLDGVCKSVTPAIRPGTQLEVRVMWLIWWYCHAPAKALRPDIWPPYALLSDHDKAIERMVLASLTGMSAILTDPIIRGRVHQGAEEASEQGGHLGHLLKMIADLLEPPKRGNRAAE